MKRSYPPLAGIVPTHCHCGTCTGFDHAVGWMSDGAGGALLLANTPCGSTLTVRELEAASVCANQACGAVILPGEIKSCGVDSDGHNEVLCAECRDSQGSRFVAFKPKMATR